MDGTHPYAVCFAAPLIRRKRWIAPRAALRRSNNMRRDPSHRHAALPVVRWSNSQIVARRVRTDIRGTLRDLLFGWCAEIVPARHVSYLGCSCASPRPDFYCKLCLVVMQSHRRARHTRGLLVMIDKTKSIISKLARDWDFATPRIGDTQHLLRCISVQKLPFCSRPAVGSDRGAVDEQARRMPSRPKGSDYG